MSNDPRLGGWVGVAAPTHVPRLLLESKKGGGAQATPPFLRIMTGQIPQGSYAEAMNGASRTVRMPAKLSAKKLTPEEQRRRYIEVARNAGASEDEAAFDSVWKKIAKAPPKAPDC